MSMKGDFFLWIRERGLPYTFVTEEDFFPVGTELLIVNLRRWEFDPSEDLSRSGYRIRIHDIREDGMVYYRHCPDGKEECFVLMKIFLVHETSVVLKSVLSVGEPSP